MAVFDGMKLTNKGLVLQGKAQAGTRLNYTRFAVGDGNISGQSIPALNGLISHKMNLPISRIAAQPPNRVAIGTVLSNATVTTGFFFREVGIFAQDPDVGEILYAYANAGATADYIGAGGGTDVIEKSFNVIVAVGTASNITATIDDSLVFALKKDTDAKFNQTSGHKHTGAPGDGPKITGDGLAAGAVGTIHIASKAVTLEKVSDDIASKEYVDNKSTRIFLSSTPPENPEIGTIWYDDKGEDYDIGDGLVVGNASFDASTDIWFEEI
ncbi:phage tail protein [Paenibacillus sp. RS8]|uniref:phage tail-collar fiber domain-containing protein n=1 Tax=Paenibacillus sp. RS8 TaxID=3242681 RepID=UPI0035C23E76